jgi:catechol 2,3-dioxygenase
MGVSTEGIFGSGRAEPAVPGSYGLAPSGFRLPDATQLGPVSLQVADLDRSLAWYEGVLGLHRLASEAGDAVLGSASGTPLVELVERRGARPVPRRGRTGLFHFAILLPDRPALGRFLRRLGDLGAPAGAADHLVSEALYLHDPDNLGIEVYVDRPRANWRRIGRELMMATDPLDADGLLTAAGGEPWAGAPAGTVMGHVHLHVNDLDVAAAFYGEGLGFDRTVWGYPGALFLAAAGYHHHLGTNLWAGAHAQPPAADEAQLLAWTLELPDAASVVAATESLERGGHAVVRGADGEVSVIDPWRTRVRLRPAVGG